MMGGEEIEQLNVSWAMCPKWATRQSAEAVQLVEGLAGKISLSMVDVQGSGSSGGRRLAIELQTFLRHQLASGIGPETAMLATNQHLLALRGGRVSAAIHIADVSSDHAVLTVCGYGLVNLAVKSSSSWVTSQLEVDLAGRNSDALPALTTILLPTCATVVLANDGFAATPDRFIAFVEALESGSSAGSPSSALLAVSIVADSGRAKSDKTVAVFTRTQQQNPDRRQTGMFTFPTNGLPGDH